MTSDGWLQIALFTIVVAVTVRPLGGYIARVFSGQMTGLAHLLSPVERGIYRLSGIDPAAEQPWHDYALALLAFNAVGLIALYLLQRLQGLLPLNPQQFAAVDPVLAVNTAVSFASNTSWQSYGGETTLSYMSQMAGITVQSFLSAATGVAAAIALIRGFARRRFATIGNFWVDVTRALLYVLLPIAIAATVFLVWQGVPQTLSSSIRAATLDGGQQLIARGPVASQEAIKLMSGDGGGFFNVNSAHPFENPTAASNLIEMVLMFVIGAALTNTFGRMIGNESHGWALLAAMAILYIAGVAAVYAAEAHGNPAFAPFGIDQRAGDLQAGGNMEGKEVRFGPGMSALFATVATDTSDGAVNAMLDSFTPIGGGVLMANMMLDEVIIGAPGSGLFSILLFAIVAVFIAGLMIGRTPEYVGKKIAAIEVKMTMLAILVIPLAILALTAVASVVSAGLAGLGNSGPHGFSEILYAFTSGAMTNGSAFAGLSANTPFYNLTLALAMFVGRYFVIVPVLAIAGSLAAKQIVPRSAGTLPTNSLLFVLFLIGVIVIVGGLTFLPAVSLGPVVEQLAMQSGRLY
jgi:potassium-transporting ATPase potassium-binding subunit